MSNFKSVKQLCEEHSNLDLHIHKLDKTITELEHKNKELENSLIELRKYKNMSIDNYGCFFLMTFSLLAIVLSIFVPNPIHKKNIEKLNKPKPVNRQKIITNDLSGNVESIHPWGRTEVVPMKSVKLEYFEYCDEWVMYGDVIQPEGRKDYFMPVMRGRLNLDARLMTETWIQQYSGYETGSIEDPETYEDFRVADIRIKSGKIIDIKYTHYRLLSDKTWSIIASWKAIVNPDIPIAIAPNVVKNDVSLIVCSACKGKGEKK